MKKLLLTALVCGLGMAQAQHYLISFTNAGENPRGLNTDDEQPSAYLTGTYTGYTQVLAPTVTGWSSALSLPFTFEFNGTDYNQFYVEANGVVSFTEPDTNTVPTEVNVDLPSALIPDNSICAWGLTLAGANDAVMTKTFGTAPDRQHWVIWASASAPELTGTNWAYWGIVMEETTNKVYVVDMRSYSSAGGNVALTIGLQYDGSNAITTTNSPNTSSNTTATSANGADASDNTYYMFAPGTQPAVDLELVGVDLAKYVAQGSSAPLTGRVRNLGANPVTSFDVTWSDGTNNFTTTVNITGNFSSGSTRTFTADDQVDPATGVVTNVSVEVEIMGDADLTNNSMTVSTSESVFTPVKAVLGEEATGTWCGWCPRGHVYMEIMEDTYEESWVGVAVHNSDPMENSTYDTWMGTRIGGYPSGLIDREETEADPTEFEDRYATSIQNFGVADISVNSVLTLDDELVVDITAHFAVSTSDDLRLAGILIESGVTGTGSTWGQTNYYSGGGSGNLSGAGHDWHDEPGTVPAADMVYDHVGRELLGGIDGDAGSVPSPVAGDDMVTYSYTIDFSDDYNVANCHVAGLLIDNASGLVLNVADGGIDREVMSTEYDQVIIVTSEGDTLVNDGGTWVNIDEVEYVGGNWVPAGTNDVAALSLSLYPNPAREQITLGGVSGQSAVTITDASGRVVMVETINGNTLNIEALQAGVYSVNVVNSGKVATEKITVIK